MHKLISAQENETHNIFLNSEKQTVYLISARRPILVIISKNKENLPYRGL